MPQVPYSPVPNVAPSGQDIPSVNVPTPGAAFGENIAAAVGGLGKTLEQGGNELFQRAYALKQLDNETEAKNGNIDFMTKAGDIHARYNSLQGMDRVNAYPKYASDLKNLYGQIRGSMSNPMSARMFDASAVSVMSRSIFSGAVMAGDAQREGALTAINAEQQILIKNAAGNYDDNDSFDAAIKQNHDTAETRAHLMPGGGSPERIELLTKQGDSTIAHERVVGMAPYHPDQAMDLLNKYKAAGTIWGHDLDDATNKIRSYTHTVGMEQVAVQTMAKYLLPDKTFSKSASDMQKEAVETATARYPDDPAIGTMAAKAMDTQLYIHNVGVTNDARAVDQRMNEYIAKGVPQVDMLPADLRSQMTPKQIREYPGMANTYERAQSVQTNKTAYDTLLGLYNNDNGKFMDTNVYKIDGLSKDNIHFFVNLQRQAQANGDPRVARAMGWLKNSVPSALADALGGDLNRTANNKDDHDQFVGALHDAIQAWQEVNQKPPSQEDVTKKIFPSLLMNNTVPGHWWGENTFKMFNTEVPADAKVAAEKDAGRALTDSEARHEYNRRTFMKLYQDQKSKAPKDQTRVQ